MFSLAITKTQLQNVIHCVSTASIVATSQQLVPVQKYDFGSGRHFSLTSGKKPFPYVQYSTHKTSKSNTWKTYTDNTGDSIIDLNDWMFDSRATRYANNLIHNEVQSLGDGVEMIKLNTWLQSNENLLPILFTGEHSRALWDKVYNYLCETPSSHVVVTGNPGIGKSRSMTYLLRKLLMEHKPVVYEARKDEVVFAFVP
jgi:hypothetical protein